MWILVLLLLIFTSNAAAAFDCSGVTLPSSIVICSNPELTRLADERQQIYNETQARLTPEQQKQLWQDQKAWVHSYAAACGVPPDRPSPIPVPDSIIECFKHAADGRAAYLRTYGMSAATGPISPNYLSGSSNEPASMAVPSNVYEVPLSIPMGSRKLSMSMVPAAWAEDFRGRSSNGQVS